MKFKITVKIWILIIALILSLLAISPSFERGVVVKSVDIDSQLYEQGLRQGEIIKSVNGEIINNKEDYARIVGGILQDNLEKRVDVETKSGSYTILTNKSLGVSVADIPKTKIKTGLDLQGGARALVQPDVDLNDNQLDDLVSVMRNRFNVFGLSDVQVRGVTDLSGNKFVLIEVAGATPGDLEDLVSQQGKFEAKIANETVFTGGEGDISDVCRNDASCASVTSCTPVQGGYACNFAFTIYLTESAAKRHAEMTGGLGLDETGRYLSEKLYLYIDESEVDSLLISSNLRGQETTEISIQGSGTGDTREEALANAKTEMNKLQTILITGSIPYKLDIVKLDNLSPLLGGEFTRAILIAGIAAMALVSIIIFIRYRKVKASLALIFTSFSEIFIILGVAAFIKWNLDLASIAGILATIGTGVDDQIIILDETFREKASGIKQKLKRAFFIIFGTYATTMVSLIPLYWAGAGLFKGFAFTTIIGITVGVLITRRAFGDIIRQIAND